MYPLLFLLLFIFVGIPIILTLINIVLIFAENKFKIRTINIFDITTFTLGIFFTILLVGFSDFNEWNEQLYFTGGKYTDGGTYTPISFESIPTFLCICLIVVVAYLLLRFLSKKLSPIIASFCYGGIFLGFCFHFSSIALISCSCFKFFTKIVS